MRLHRLVIMSALALAVSGWSSSASAQGDTFGIGDGHSGPRSVATANAIVNTYAGVTEDIAPGATTITITTQLVGSDAFAAKDLILVWRATGVAASEAPSGDRTKRLDLASALATTSTTLSAGAVGRYELARVKSVNGSVLTLEQPMLGAFAKTVTQVVRVPEFTTVDVAAGASLVAAPWQELGASPDLAAPNPNAQWVGGIVIFFANGAITNAGTIHANGRGFHGATPAQRAISNLGLFCDGSTLDGDPTATNGAFAPKGEGVVQSKFNAQSGGKGNISMAGGGGNCLESGGGGGANQGNGGNGSAALGAASNGLGGVGIDYDVLRRLTMGGGGGAGRHIVGLLGSQVSFGGFGGGVVYIRGASLGGTGNLQSNGANGEDSGLVGLPTALASESSGGGGAGGTIVVRLTGTLDCGQLASNGGNGGNAEVAGLPVLGAGGGGGGGRILFQASSKTGTCNVSVNPGNAGNHQGGGAQNGSPGTTVPDLPPLCLPASPSAPGTCPDGTPVCDPTTGQCAKCSGPFGSGPPDPCEVATKPVCNGDGTCQPCGGDFGSGAANACQLANAPTCFASRDPAIAGSCGKCTTDTDCTAGTHSGPTCDVASGACGVSCTKDEDCPTSQWCAPTNPATSTNGVCVPKVPNSQPVPTNPPINGECTPANGQRTCLSAVCEESDDLCGKRNSSPCPGGQAQCRSDVCFDRDKLCGFPNGEPCQADPQCRSELCKDGVCTGKPCGSDTDCPAPGQVCDPNSNTCVDGCRPEVSALADGGVVNGVCPPGATCVSPDGGPIGQCEPGDAGTGDGGGLGPLGDGGSTLGLIEGGGCSCSSTISSATSPLALLGGALGVLGLFRRRGSRKARG